MFQLYLWVKKLCRTSIYIWKFFFFSKRYNSYLKACFFHLEDCVRFSVWKTLVKLERNFLAALLSELFAFSLWFSQVGKTGIALVFPSWPEGHLCTPVAALFLQCLNGVVLSLQCSLSSWLLGLWKWQPVPPLWQHHLSEEQDLRSCLWSGILWQQVDQRVWRWVSLLRKQLSWQASSGFWGSVHWVACLELSFVQFCVGCWKLAASFSPTCSFIKCACTWFSKWVFFSLKAFIQ